MSVTLNVSALKTRESTSDPWQGTVVKSDAILDAGTITYDGTETYTAGTVGEELNSQRNTLTQLGNDIATILQDPAQDTFTEGTYVVYNNQLYTVKAGGIPAGTAASAYYPSMLTAVSGGGLNSIKKEMTVQVLTLTRTANSLQTQAMFENIFAYKKSGILFLYFDGEFTTGVSATAFTEIGTIAGWNGKTAILQTIVGQVGSSITRMTLYVLAGGSIQVYIPSATPSGERYRTVVSIPSND